MNEVSRQEYEAVVLMLRNQVKAMEQAHAAEIAAKDAELFLLHRQMDQRLSEILERDQATSRLLEHASKLEKSVWESGKEIARLRAALAGKDKEMEDAIEQRENDIWTDVERACQQAWPNKPIGYAESPLELVIKIIDERDDLRARVTELEAAIPDAGLLRMVVCSGLPYGSRFVRPLIAAAEKIEKVKP